MCNLCGVAQCSFCLISIQLQLWMIPPEASASTSRPAPLVQPRCLNAFRRSTHSFLV